MFSHKGIWPWGEGRPQRGQDWNVGPLLYQLPVAGGRGRWCGLEPTGFLRGFAVASHHGTFLLQVILPAGPSATQDVPVPGV